jgi:hypothetical protein
MNKVAVVTGGAGGIGQVIAANYRDVEMTRREPREFRSVTREEAKTSQQLSPVLQTTRQTRDRTNHSREWRKTMS